MKKNEGKMKNPEKKESWGMEKKKKIRPKERKSWARSVHGVAKTSAHGGRPIQPPSGHGNALGKVTILNN